MSLLALALQIAATGALAEVMPAWVRVEMEPAEPLKVAEDGSQVLVATFIGDEVSKVTRRRWQDGEVTIELVVQVVLPAEIVATLGGVATRFDVKRGGTRPIYAAVHRMIERAFTAPVPGSWGELLQAIVVAHPEELHGMPGVAERTGKASMPVCDYSIPCRTISSPPLGVDPPYPWPDLVAKMRTDADFRGSADFVEALVRGDPLPAWRAELALAGLSHAEGSALGIGTLEGIDGTPEATRLTVGTGRRDIVVEAAP